MGGAIEVLPRTGILVTVDPNGERMVDMTEGVEIYPNDAITLQHLYLIPRADARGIKVLSDSAWVLVRGSYRVDKE